MISQQAKPSTFSAIVELAKPVFILLAIALPIGGLVVALISGSIAYLIMATLRF